MDNPDIRIKRDTEPRTLSGIPRVAGVAPETPAEDVRNALAILRLVGQWRGELPENRALGEHYVIARADYEAITARLETAVTKLERK